MSTTAQPGDKGPDPLEDAREYARKAIREHLEFTVIRVVDWGTVTFAADGSAFVEAIVEVPVRALQRKEEQT